MSYQITDISGITRLMPDHSKMVEIVDEMYREEDHEPFQDVIMSHNSGTSISLHPNGCAVLDSSNNEKYYTLTTLDKEDQLMLWIQLAAGNIRAIRQLDWKSENE